jgi:hypothetical protein
MYFHLLLFRCFQRSKKRRISKRILREIRRGYGTAMIYPNRQMSADAIR